MYVKVAGILLLSSVLLFSKCFSQSFQNVTVLNKYLLDETRNLRTIRPVHNQTNPSEVRLQLLLHRLISFDDIHGLLRIVGSFGMWWKDELKVWDKIYFGISKIHLKASDVWTPDVKLVNQGGELLSVRCTTADDEVTYDDKGNAYCFISRLFIVSCSPNMFKFPFDENVCSFEFQASVAESEVKFVKPIFDAEINFEGSFLQWKLSPLYFNLTRNEKYRISKVIYFVLLKRSPYFILLNIVFPNCILGIVHLLVFFLPIESGERIGYSITIYLALVVFMSNISSILPQTSNPISVFNVMVFSQLWISSCIMAAVIFISRVYHLDGRIRVSALFKKLFRRKNIELDGQKRSDSLNPWKDIGKSLDRVMFYLFLLSFLAEVLTVFLLIKYA